MMPLELVCVPDQEPLGPLQQAGVRKSRTNGAPLETIRPLELAGTPDHDPFLFIFLFVKSGPSKNSVPNPMSFYFGGVLHWAPTNLGS